MKKPILLLTLLALFPLLAIAGGHIYNSQEEYVDMLIEKFGKDKIVDIIQSERNGSISLRIKYGIIDYSGHPDLNYITSQSILNDLVKIGWDLLDLNDKLEERSKPEEKDVRTFSLGPSGSKKAGQAVINSDSETLSKNEEKDIGPDESSQGGQATARMVYTGCGIILDIQAGNFVIAGMIGNSPAERSGICQGDVIAGVEKWRGSLNPGEQVSYGSLYNALNPGIRNTEITVKVLRDSQAKEFKLRSECLLIDATTAPKSTFSPGTLEYIDGHAYAKFPDPDKYRAGDFFYVFNSGEHLGTARLTARDGSRFVAIVQVNSREKADNSILCFLKHDYSVIDALNGQNYTRGFGSATLALVTEDSQCSISQEQEDKVFRNFEARKDLKRGTGTVITHNSAQNFFLIKVSMDTSSISPSSAVMRFENVFVYYTPETRFIPVDGPEKIRSGKTIGFFYKESHQRKMAELVHLLSE